MKLSETRKLNEIWVLRAVKIARATAQIEKSSRGDKSDSRHRNYSIIMYEMYNLWIFDAHFLLVPQSPAVATCQFIIFVWQQICGRAADRITSQPEFRNYPHKRKRRASNGLRKIWTNCWKKDVAETAAPWPFNQIAWDELRLRLASELTSEYIYSRAYRAISVDSEKTINSLIKWSSRKLPVCRICSGHIKITM